MKTSDGIASGVSTLFALGILVALAPAGAATIVVGETAPGVGAVLVANDSFCSLREAIENANDLDATQHVDCTSGTPGGPDDIVLPAGATFTLEDAPGLYDTDGPNGLPSLTSDVTVLGNGAVVVRDAGAPRFRPLHVSAGATVRLEDVTIRGGFTPTVNTRGLHGGGILNRGTLTLVRSEVAENETGSGVPGDVPDGADGGDGGGIWSSGPLTVLRSRIVDNRCGDAAVTGEIGDDDGLAGNGGGIYAAGPLIVSESTIAGNRAGDQVGDDGDSFPGQAGSGGGIFGSDIQITRSTISGNTAGTPSFGHEHGVGGGVACGGFFLAPLSCTSLRVTNSTISGNSVAFLGDGGGLFVQGAALELEHATVTGNTNGGVTLGVDDGPPPPASPTIQLTLTHSLIASQASGADCTLQFIADGHTADEYILSNGYNLDSDGSCELDAASDFPSGTADLGPLADNGGPTFTHLPGPGSDAIDAIPLADCDPAHAPDQRGVPRPRPAGGACDIGAVEVGEIGAYLSVTKVDSPDPVVAGTTVTYTVEVTNVGPLDAADVQLADVLPAGTSLVSSNGCGEDPAGAPTCTVGPLLAGTVASVELTVLIAANVPHGTLLTNTVTVSSSTLDPEPSDDTATAETAVVAQANVSLTKSASPNPVLAGGQLQYTLTVFNAGPSDAQGVTVADSLPAGVDLVATTGCIEDPVGVPTCSLGTVAAGASVPITVTVTVQADLADGTVLSNTATVATTTADASAADDSDSAEVSVAAVSAPPPPVSDIPTLATLPLALLVLLLALGGAAVLRGR
jgi:uncharacterized repeat protein (TIGR01451 family)